MISGMYKQLLANRSRLQYRYFFNAGLDRETGICDAEGSDVVTIESDGSERYLGSVYGYTPVELCRMSDDEFKLALDAAFKPAAAVD